VKDVASDGRDDRDGLNDLSRSLPKKTFYDIIILST